MAKAKPQPATDVAETIEPATIEPATFEPTTEPATTEPTTFRVNAAWASTVTLVGEFNDWSTEATPMQRVGDTEEFVAELPLEPGRSYRYKFFLDGERWENDPNADDYVANEYGGHDSVRTL